MIYKAKISGYSVIDAIKVVTAVHQIHGYSHFSQKRGPKYEELVGDRNIILAGGSSNMPIIDDAD